jgi:hypothetical protein
MNAIVEVDIRIRASRTDKGSTTVITSAPAPMDEERS